MSQGIRKFANGLGILPKTTSTADTAGEIEILSSDNRLRLRDGSSVKVVTLNTSTDTLTNKTIDASSNTISNITNTNISASANIALSKLATLTASKALVSDSSGVITASAVTSTELSYLSGVTSAIQTQLNNKQSSGSYITALTGDVTTSGSTATISANSVTNSKLAQMAQSTIKGRAASSGTGDSVDLTATQATAILDAFTSSLKGLVPASGGGTTNFLRADGSWAAPSGGTTSPLTTKGDLWGYSTTNVRLPVGTNGQVLTADSTQALGVKWSTPTAANITYTGTAGETLATNDAVYISPGGTDSGRTAGSIYKLDPSKNIRSMFAGIVTSGVSSGNTVTIQVCGELTGFTGLLQGQPAYASATTPGSFQLTSPNPVEANSIIIGWGSTATTKLIINASFTSQLVLNNVQNGYSIAGFNASGTDLNTINKMSFSAETSATLSDTLAATVHIHASTCSTEKGYSMGGIASGSPSSAIRTLLFSTDATGSLTATLPATNYGTWGNSSALAGYLGGKGDTESTVIYKLTFSSEATSTISGTLTFSGPSYLGGTSSKTSSYWTGGSGFTGTVCKMVYSTESTSSLGGTISTPVRFVGGAFASVKGYIMGGMNSSNVRQTAIRSIDFVTDSVGTLSAVLSTARAEASYCSSAAKGYMQGGSIVGSTTANTTNEYLNFSTETVSNAANAIAVARGEAVGTQG